MKTINALERRLDVLRKLNERHGQSLAELQRPPSRHPQPSLLRILDTLGQRLRLAGHRQRALPAALTH